MSCQSLFSRHLQQHGGHWWSLHPKPETVYMTLKPTLQVDLKSAGAKQQPEEVTYYTLCGLFARYYILNLFADPSRADET